MIHSLKRKEQEMKKIRSYTGIWNVEKVLYAINDFQEAAHASDNGG